MRTSPVIPLGTLLVLLVAPSGPAAQPVPDHLKCYRFRDPLRLRGPKPAWLDLSGAQFGSERCRIVGSFRLLCVPVTKTVTGVIQRKFPGGSFEDFTPSPLGGAPLTEDEVCYKIKCTDNRPEPPNPAQGLSDQFGTRVGTRFEPFLLCGPAVKVPPPTTTTTSASSTSTTITTTTTAPTTTTCASLDFSVTPPSLITTSGETRDASSTILKDLHVGGLNIGGGASTQTESPFPECGTNRFSVCGAPVATVGPTSVPGAGFDCTDTGCNFGPPVPISNGGTSVCLSFTFAGPAAGTVDTSTGDASVDLPLDADVVLTGNALSPCPRCAAGICDAGPNVGMACTASCNSQGTTRDCPPGGQNLGTTFMDLDPLATGTVVATSPGGIFCTGQTAGCFGDGTCVEIENTGVPFGPLSSTPAAGRLASNFCVPALPGASGAAVNLALDLPGPGSISLPGKLVLLP
jgi:hypothetical protein